MRALYKFGKKAKVAYISHLDLQRFMQMALRRTDLPAAYSQGFNPHPLISFASALATGWTSEAEIVDIKMARDIDEEFAFSQMKRALPPDIPLLATRLVSDSFPALMAKLEMADYEIKLKNARAYESAIDGFMKSESVMAMRKTKSGEKLTDIRPMAVTAHVLDDGTILARLRLSEKMTLKPDLFIRTLCETGNIDVDEDLSIHRLRLLTTGKNGEAEDLFTCVP
ncbi:MAG: TIGR03936 family radical SAM-associated protein [Clostridia bacterium]|nr:TIGR03936 family radical SAM-associated protein [Clostridia bacterium]